MSSLTSYRPYHVYTLRQALGPFSHVILITALDFVNHHAQRVVTVLPLSFRDRAITTDTRVKIRCQGSGGYAQLSGDHFAAIDGVMAMERKYLILSSASEIHPLEEEEIKRKLGAYLGM